MMVGPLKSLFLPRGKGEEGNHRGGQHGHPAKTANPGAMQWHQACPGQVQVCGLSCKLLGRANPLPQL